MNAIVLWRRKQLLPAPFYSTMDLSLSRENHKLSSLMTSREEDQHWDFGRRLEECVAAARRSMAGWSSAGLVFFCYTTAAIKEEAVSVLFAHNRLEEVTGTPLSPVIQLEKVMITIV